MQRPDALLFSGRSKTLKTMKHLFLTGLLLSGACFTAQAQGGYQDDVYSSAPVPPSGNSGNSNSSGNQQRPNNGSFDNRNGGNGSYNNGNNSYGDSYADDYDYIDYQNDAYYASRFRRFNDPFYNVGYWSSFWGPSYGVYGGYGGYGGYGYGGSGISISIGYGGPYWSSAWGWNNWYGYGGFSSYWNYPYYAGGWGGNPWMGAYGQGYNNGYWNGYYAGLYGAGIGNGYGNGYNAGYRNVTYGPRDGGLNGSYSGYRNRVTGTDGYRPTTPANGNGNMVPGITDGGRRVPTVIDGNVTPVRSSGNEALSDRGAIKNNAAPRDQATLKTNDRAVRVNDGNSVTPPNGRFTESAGSNDRLPITRDGSGKRITESPVRNNRVETGNRVEAAPTPTRAPRGGWFEENSNRNSTFDRQQSAPEAVPRSNGGSNRNEIMDRPVRSFEQSAPAQREQPRAMPQRSFEQPRQRSFEQPQQRSFEQPQQRSFEQPQQRSFDQPQQRSFERPQQQAPQMQQRSFEQPQQRSFSRPQMSAPSTPSGGGFRGGGGGGGGNFGGGMRR